MSFIVKGIDLPKEGTLTFRITRHGKAYEITNNGYYIKGTETEAVQIPKGHGRLIDETKINDALLRDDGRQFDTDAPTILEAET